MANKSPKPVIFSLRVPPNYPNVPMPGKIRLLYDTNKRALYHRLSPYGFDTFLGIKTRQPFFYTYPDEARSSSEHFIVDLAKRSTIDVERVSKWMLSQNGILFITNQFLMQSGNAFNETRIWNPTSPSVAAGMPLTFWSARPTRHVDTSDLLGSFLGGIGKTIGGIFGVGNSPPPPPSGTAGESALSDWNKADGKGLLRAQTAETAKSKLLLKYGTKAPGSFFGNLLKGLFANFIPAKQTGLDNQGIQYRDDERMYGVFLDAVMHGKFSYRGGSQLWSQPLTRWIGGLPPNGKGIRNSQQDGGNAATGRMMTKPNGREVQTISGRKVEKTVKVYNNDSIRIGYNASVSSDINYTGIRYEDAVGTKHDAEFYASEQMVSWEYFQNPENLYKSKGIDRTDIGVIKTRESLQKVIDHINKVKTSPNADPTYEVDEDHSKDSSILPPAYQKDIGYNRILQMRGKYTPDINYQYGVLNEYRTRIVRVLEDQHSEVPIEKSLKMASSRQSDWINNLTVLDGKTVREGAEWNGLKWKVWQPYRDDLIAFYFYDVVNDKYIPFRAIIRGVQETNSATWEELSFIGRADRLYSYSGYNRSLTFSFTVHISSIMELAPTWQRINYLMSLVKPSGYTQKKDVSATTNLHTRYIVPPMVMITIGDLYKQQPVVLASAGISIPDTAIWETLNEENSPYGWSYLVDYIKAPQLGNKYAQMPLTAEISINAYVLEKERAIVGAAHFGHAPHTETYERDKYRTTTPDFQEPNEFHKSLVVYNESKSTPQKTS